jgi:hypothetical protein
VKTTVKGALKSKTNWLGLSLMVLGYLEMKQDLLLQYVPQHWQGAATLALGGSVMVTRFFTTQSLSEKGTTGQPDDTDERSGV